METTHHELGYNLMMMEDSRNMMIIKGKRTKRQRSSSPLAITMASTSSTTDQDYADTLHNHPNNTFFNIPTNSIHFNRSVIIQENDNEEEDMANCLILLAQGQAQPHSSPSPPPNKSAVVDAMSSGFNYVYECKTCNRGFSSFQALGGHRASHKKPPKPTLQEKSTPTTMDMVIAKQDDNRSSTSCTALSLQLGLSNRNPSGVMKVTKVHECSICGAEFGSGQALGGHMRRHRSIMPTTTHSDDGCQDSKKPKLLLSLDLNLPAPVEDHDHHTETKLPFRSKDQLIVFSNSSLVHCHF